jgi:hypothetical protein
MPSTALQLNPVRLRARTQLGLFFAAYLLYTAGRWVVNAELGQATEHPRWIVRHEEDLGLAAGLGAAVAGYLVGRAIQRIRLALEGPLDAERDLAAVGFVADRHGLGPLLDRCDPDVPPRRPQPVR